MRYKCDKILNFWSDKYKYQIWYRVEMAFLNAFKGVVILDLEIRDDDVKDIQEIENKTKHDVAAFVEWMEQFYEDCDWSRFIHYGLTSSDIVDTSFTIIMQDVNFTLNALLDILIDKLGLLPDSNIVGRTHGQIAEIRRFKDKIKQYQQILKSLKLSIPSEGKLSGSVGDHKHVTEEICEKALNIFALLQTKMTDGQVISRVYYVKYALEWANLAAYIEKIATDFRLLAQSEIGEVSEYFADDQIGSSSMPHKKNPIILENICGNARMVKNLSVSALDSVVIWNERDISHSSMERMIYPQASNLLGYIISKLTDVISTININVDIMNNRAKENFDITSSQEEMLKLIDHGISRKEAHKKFH